MIEVRPSRVSPVLKGIIDLRVEGFSDVLIREDMEVYLKNIKGETRQINVVEVGAIDSDQYIKVKFGGADSGFYGLIVRSKMYGRFDTTGMTLEAVGRVTSFSPTQGSIHGGTLITIKGYNFSTDI